MHRPAAETPPHHWLRYRIPASSCGRGASWRQRPVRASPMVRCSSIIVGSHRPARVWRCINGRYTRFSRREPVGHPRRVSPNARVPVIHPRIKEPPPGARDEDHFVVRDRSPERFDLVTVPGLCAFNHGSPRRRPEFRLGMEIEQDRSEAAMPVRPVNLGAKCERMLEELRGIQVGKQAGLVAQVVANVFVSLHFVAPDWTPVCVAQ